ncbi:hypothetical protein AX16_001803 [Volvariella volvacea WC 439]|nr:hypothetical protein AX16_001803 [Volvariella volvacea WC 439]
MLPLSMVLHSRYLGMVRGASLADSRIANLRVQGTGIQLLGLAANISYVTILDGEHVQSPTVDSNENILASFQNLTNSVHSLTLQVVAPVSQPSPPTSVLFFDRALINTSPPSDTLSNVTFATRPLNDANIAFLGRWSFIEDSDGSSHVSTTRGDRVRTRFLGKFILPSRSKCYIYITLQLLGTSLQLFGTTSPQSGLYNIKVDNITTTLSARSSFTNDNSLLFFTSGLSMDQYHTLEVENVDGSLAVRSGGFLVGVPQDSYVSSFLNIARLLRNFDSTSLPIPPTLPSNSPAIEANNSVSFPPGAIAALALGGFLAFLIITGCIYYFFVYRPRRERRLGACSATGQLQEKPRDVGVVIDITQEANVTVDPRPYSGSGKWKLDLEQGRKSLRSLGIAFRRPGTTDDGEEKVDDQDLYRNASSITPPSSASGVGQTPENNGGNGKGKGKAIAIFKSTRASTRSRSSWTSSFAIDLSQFRSHSRSDTLSNIAGQSGVPHSPISLTTELAALANSNSNPNSPPAARPLPSTSSNRPPPPPLSLSNPTRTAPPPVPLQRTHTRGGSTIPLLQSTDHHDSHNDDLGSPPNFPVNVIPRHPYASASRRTDSDSDYDPYHDQDQEFITTADIPLIDTTIAVSEFGQGNDVGGGDVRRPLPVPVPVSVSPPVPPVPAPVPIPPSAEPMQPSQVRAQAASQETRRPVRKLPAIPQAQVAPTPGPSTSTSTTSGFTTPSTSPPAMASAAAAGRSLPLPPIISREPTPPRSNSPVLVASPSRFDGFSLDRPSTLPTNTQTQAQTLATPDLDVERDQDQSAQRRLFRLTPPSIHPQSTGGGSRSGSGSDSTTAEQQSFIDYDHSYSPTTTRSNTMSTHDSMSRAGSMRTYGTHGGSRDVNLLAYVHGRHRHGHSQSLSRSQSQGEGRPAFNARLSAVPPLPLPTSLTPVPTPSPSPPSHSTSQTVTPQPMLQRQVTGPSSPPVLPPVFARSPSPAPAPAPAPAPVLAPPAPPRLILPPFAPQNPPSPSPMTGEPLSSISTTDIDTLTGNRESSLYNMYFSPSQFPPVPFSHMQNQSYTQDQGRGRGQGHGPGQSSSRQERSRDSEIISPISSYQQPLSAAMASSDLQHTDFFEFHRDRERDLHPQRRMRTASGLSGYGYASGSGGGSGPTTPQRGSEREGEPRGQEQERRWGR